MANTATIYVALMDEGVDVWRPVMATRLGDNLFRLTDDPPDNERWEFQPGSTVRAERRHLSEGPALVAVQLAD